MKVIDLKTINDLRNGALMAQQIGKQIELIKKMKNIVKGVLLS